MEHGKARRGSGISGTIALPGGSNGFAVVNRSLHLGTGAAYREPGFALRRSRAAALVLPQ